MIVPLSARRILVADDDESVLRILHDSLTRAGFDVELAVHGHELLRRYRAAAYALLILDVRMSPRTGLEVVTLLRDRDDAVPIILMSPGSRRVGPFAFMYRVELLHKPFSLRELKEAISRATARPDP